MRTETSAKIVAYIRANRLARPVDLAEHLSISPQALHSQLRRLLAAGTIQRMGSPPHTAYALKEKAHLFRSLPAPLTKLLEAEYAFQDPTGAVLFGVNGFQKWVAAKNLNKDYLSLAQAYAGTRQTIYDRNKSKPIDTTPRLEGILKELAIDSATISDFYAIPQFGKTKLGVLVHVAKTAPRREWINLIAHLIQGDLSKITSTYEIDSICFVPHSVPRQRPFLPELKKQLKFSLASISARKYFAGGTPIAQKSLPRLSERIANARATVMIDKSSTLPQRLLIFDDAIGSGATINELAKLFRAAFPSLKAIHGYAIVGSYKGFDVLPQV